MERDKHKLHLQAAAVRRQSQLHCTTFHRNLFAHINCQLELAMDQEMIHHTVVVIRWRRFEADSLLKLSAVRSARQRCRSFESFCEYVCGVDRITWTQEERRRAENNVISLKLYVLDIYMRKIFSFSLQLLIRHFKILKIQIEILRWSGRLTLWLLHVPIVLIAIIRHSNGLLCVRWTFWKKNLMCRAHDESVELHRNLLKCWRIHKSYFTKSPEKMLNIRRNWRVHSLIPTSWNNTKLYRFTDSKI